LEALSLKPGSIAANKSVCSKMQREGLQHGLKQLRENPPHL
jgi:hypothetical protein